MFASHWSISAFHHSGHSIATCTHTFFLVRATPPMPLQPPAGMTGLGWVSLLVTLISTFHWPCFLRWWPCFLRWSLVRWWLCFSGPHFDDWVCQDVVVAIIATLQIAHKALTTHGTQLFRFPIVSIMFDRTPAMKCIY